MQPPQGYTKRKKGTKEPMTEPEVNLLKQKAERKSFIASSIQNARARVSYSMIALAIHIIHFIFLQAAFSAPSSTEAGLCLAIATRGLRRTSLTATAMPAKLNGLEFSSLTRPHAEEDHHSRAGELKTPPKQVRRNRPGVDNCSHKMKEVNRQSEIRNQFRPGNEQKEENDAASKIVSYQFRIVRSTVPAS